jgi:hypothetical protein
MVVDRENTNAELPSLILDVLLRLAAVARVARAAVRRHNH